MATGQNSVTERNVCTCVRDRVFVPVFATAWYLWYGTIAVSGACRPREDWKAGNDGKTGVRHTGRAAAYNYGTGYRYEKVSYRGIVTR